MKTTESNSPHYKELQPSSLCLPAVLTGVLSTRSSCRTIEIVQALILHGALSFVIANLLCVLRKRKSFATEFQPVEPFLCQL